MLLKGFRSAKSGEKETYVWVARREGTIFQPNITGVGAQNDFYSVPSTDGAPTLDDAITAYEIRLGAMLGELRALEIGAAAPEESALEVVSHLTQRVPGFRYLMGNTVADLMGQASDHFGKPEAIRRMAGLDGPEPTAAFRSKALTEFRTHAAREKFDEFPDDVLVAMAYAQMREGYDTLVAPQAAVLEGALRALAADAHEEAADTHRRMLAEDVASRARADFLEGYRWRIEAAPDEGCILPDCVALGMTQAGELQPFLICDRNDVRGVALPLTMDRLLVGAPPNGAWPPLTTFNAAAAAASDDFFVAHVRRPDMEKLKARIGSVTVPFRVDLVDKAMREFAGRQALAPRIAPPTPPPRNCSVEAGLGDNDVAVKAIARTRALIARLGEHLALDRLVSVSFVPLPAFALVCLDRGDPRLPPYTHDMFPEDLGAASPVIVYDGELCSKTFLDNDIAWALGDDDEPDDVATAMHLIAHQLAEVSATRRIEQALPGFLLDPIEDPHVNRLVLPAMRGVLGYHAALQSAGFGSDALFEARYRDALLNTLDRARAVLEPIAEELAPSGDLGAYYGTGLACADAILVAAAHLAGHRAGLDRDSVLDDPNLQERLGQEKLRGWFDVYAADLADFWEVAGSWTSAAPFLAFHRHTERVLWALGIIPTPMPDGDTFLLSPAAFQALEGS